MLRSIVLAGLAMTALVQAALAQAPAAPPPAPAPAVPLYTATYVEVGPADTRAATGALKAYRDAARKDAGNMQAQLMQGINRSNQYVVLGIWKDQKAYDDHVAAAHTKQMVEKITAIQAAPNDTRQHAGLSVAEPAKGKAAVCAVTHVDVIPPQRENGTNAVKQLSEDSRKHAGNLAFNVLVQTNRPNHFTVVECWKDRKSFDAHIVAKETKDFRNKLVTMTGALYDERLLKPVD